MIKNKSYMYYANNYLLYITIIVHIFKLDLSYVSILHRICRRHSSVIKEYNRVSFSLQTEIFKPGLQLITFVLAYREVPSPHWNDVHRFWWTLFIEMWISKFAASNSRVIRNLVRTSSCLATRNQANRINIPSHKKHACLPIFRVQWILNQVWLVYRQSFDYLISTYLLLRCVYSTSIRFDCLTPIVHRLIWLSAKCTNRWPFSPSCKIHT